MKPILATLDEAQRELWSDLAPAAHLGFVLYGGTAVALRYGHRLSIDFDFFTERALDKIALRSAMPLLQGATVLQDSVDTLTVLTATPRQVKLSFFGSLSIGRVGEPERTDDGVLVVASSLDLLATKWKAIFDRIEAKDYLDIAAIVRGGTSLDDGLAAGRALFGSAFQASEALKALVYFHGGDLDELSAEDREYLIAAASAVRRIPAMQRVSSSLSVG
uniref:Protein containing DUF1814 n=1 Tax=mine drainage metagenome TaxID=410659 RepID=E6Q4S8_9ZZZZ